MNMWGLTPPFVREMEAGFERFLDGGALQDPKSEFLLPEYIGGLLDGLSAERSAISKYILCRRYEPLN